MSPDPEKPLVSCLILNWNRLRETARCIESIRNQSYPNIELLLVDNNSDDGSKEFFRNCPMVDTYVELEKNYGCPGGRNRGIRKCKGEYIFFIDNDGLLHEKAVENAMSLMCRSPELAVVTGQIIDFIDVKGVDTQSVLEESLPQSRVNFDGGISLHRKEIYNLVGFYPDDYVYGAEESYLSLRILDEDLLIYESADVVLYHKKSINARDVKRENIHLWMNTFYNAYQTYPIVCFLIYILYFHLAYSIYAIRGRIFWDFIQKLPTLYAKFYGYPRKPVKMAVFLKFFFKR